MSHPDQFAHLFQFTRPRGARRAHATIRGARARFNSRAHGGRDERKGLFPARKSGFNSRAHGGRDDRRFTVADFCTVFQFTRPRGARHFFSLPLDGVREFQFTRPRGARLLSPALHQGGLQFQFTRPRGARPMAPSRSRCVLLFQFTRPRGARHHRHSITHVYHGFNSRAHGGRDA